MGHERQARTSFEKLAAEGFATLPFDNHWLFCMALLSEAAFFLADSHRAKSLYDRLLPYAERTSLAAGDGITGSMSGPLGLLAAVLSRLDEAEHHFDKAIEQSTRMGAWPSLAHNQFNLAAMLMRRDSTGDQERGVELLTHAASICDEVGMTALRTKVIAAMERPDATSAPGRAPTVVEDSSGSDGTFRLEGEYWTVTYEGRVLRLRDSKGMRVLSDLLANPGRPRASLDLERLGIHGDEMTARALAAGDAGEILDEQARRAYRARVAELREAMEEAEAGGKADQAGAMREETDFINRELGRALGLGGRSRHAGSTAERARLNVTRAVKSAMYRIAAADPELALHLQATVRTGTVCVYAPDPRSPVGWRVSAG
jgi:hypothetical protein